MKAPSQPLPRTPARRADSDGAEDWSRGQEEGRYRSWIGRGGARAGRLQPDLGIQRRFDASTASACGGDGSGYSSNISSDTDRRVRDSGSSAAESGSGERYARGDEGTGIDGESRSDASSRVDGASGVTGVLGQGTEYLLDELGARDRGGKGTGASAAGCASG